MALALSCKPVMTVTTAIGTMMAIKRHQPGSTRLRRVLGSRLILIKAAHPPNRQSEWDGQLSGGGAQERRVELVLVKHH